MKCSYVVLSGFLHSFYPELFLFRGRMLEFFSKRKKKKESGERQGSWVQNTKKMKTKASRTVEQTNQQHTIPWRRRRYKYFCLLFPYTLRLCYFPSVSSGKQLYSYLPNADWMRKRDFQCRVHSTSSNSNLNRCPTPLFIPLCWRTSGPEKVNMDVDN